MKKLLIFLLSYLSIGIIVCFVNYIIIFIKHKKEKEKQKNQTWKNQD